MHDLRQHFWAGLRAWQPQEEVQVATDRPTCTFEIAADHSRRSATAVQKLRRRPRLPGSAETSTQLPSCRRLSCLATVRHGGLPGMPLTMRHYAIECMTLHVAHCAGCTVDCSCLLTEDRDHGCPRPQAR